jgi:hypothetical protein
MTDWNIERYRVLAGQGDDLADLLGRERRRCAGARGVAQAGRHTGRCCRIQPSAAPMTGRLAPYSQPSRGLVDPKAGCGEQNDPGSFRQLLRSRMGSDQRIQVPLLLGRQLDR